jgi:Tol biopolymer transport system component
MRRSRRTLLALVVVAAACVGPIEAAQAAFPGANGRITWYTDRAGGYDIFSMNPNGTAVTNLTNSPAGDVAPAWSADGSKIAFQQCPATNIDCIAPTLHVMNADGGGDVSLGVNAAGPAWSPDGSKIVYANAPNERLHVINADGTGDQELPIASPEAVDPAWSPDGTKIAYAGFVPGAWFEIFTVDSDGTNPQRLTFDSVAQSSPNEALNVAPNWSPDGTKIVWWHAGNPKSDIYTMNADGTGKANLTGADGRFDEDPAWSPDGTKITYNTCCGYDIFVMNADGSNQTPLTFGGATNRGPDWQPLPGDHAPNCSGVTATPNVLSPADGTLRLVTISGATDPDGDTPTIHVDGVTQDEPLTGKGDRTSPDATAGPSPNQVNLRAERQNSGDGRVYRVSFTATDARGAICSGTVSVGVPKTKNRSAVDSAPPSYNSFGP